jgi:uncharacterized protein with FMN-binding domain
MRNETRKKIASVLAAAALGTGAFTFAASPSGAARTAASLAGDGTFSGRREYAYYGFVRVQAVVKNGTLTDVKVLEYPNDNGRSHYINSVALPYLIQEAVDAQSSRVDVISGATFTSVAFTKSLQEALRQAGA